MVKKWSISPPPPPPSLSQPNDSPGAVVATGFNDPIFSLNLARVRNLLLCRCYTTGPAGQRTCRNLQQNHILKLRNLKCGHRPGSTMPIASPTNRPKNITLSAVNSSRCATQMPLMAGFIYRWSRQETPGDFMWFVTSTEALICKVTKVQWRC